MRVTAAQVYRSQLLRLRKRSSESARAQEVATSGRRLVRPSDDPVGAARSLRVRDMLGDVETARGKIATVHRELTHEETAIAGMTDVLSRVKELAVQMASPVADAGSRAAAASEVDGLRSQLIALANTDVAGRRLFGGSQIGSDPFDAAGNYLGDTAPVSVEIYNTSTVQVTMDGSQLIGGTGGGPDILQVLDDFSTALNANDITGVQNTLDPLTDSIDWVVQQRSLIGARMDLVERLDDHLQDVESSLVDERSAIEEADVVEAYSEVVRTKTAFESALQVTSAARTTDIFQLLGL